MSQQRMEHAMKILLLSGDARAKCMDALVAVSNCENMIASECLSEAQNIITKAHRLQTEIIQEDINREHSEYSLLFSHAQDTLMATYSEINIAKQLINIFYQYDQRLSKLENKENK